MKLKKAIESLQLLLKKGNDFTYENFSTKGEYGYSSSCTPDWIAWQTRVKSIISKLFGEGSAPYSMLESGLNIELIGYGPDEFSQAKSYFLGALSAAFDVLQEDVFGELDNIKAIGPTKFSNEVFIVHGHDEKSKNELSIFLKEIGLEAIILR